MSTRPQYAIQVQNISYEILDDLAEILNQIYPDSKTLVMETVQLITDDKTIAKSLEQMFSKNGDRLTFQPTKNEDWIKSIDPFEIARPAASRKMIRLWKILDCPDKEAIGRELSTQSLNKKLQKKEIPIGTRLEFPGRPVQLVTPAHTLVEA